MYLSGGVGSGLGVVILVAVAAGSVLVTGRASAFLAAVATIVVLYEEFYVSLTTPEYAATIFRPGFSARSILRRRSAIQSLSTRLRRTEIMSLSRAAEVADLERVNRSIIQRMRTGIIVVDADDRPRVLNQSARSLLGLADHDDTDAGIAAGRCSIDCRRGVPIRRCAPALSRSRRPRRRSAPISARCAPSGPTPTSSCSSKTPSKFSSRRNS